MSATTSAHAAAARAGVQTARVALKKNKQFKRDGVTSYGNILKKYNIQPTLPGPFTMVEQLFHGGDHSDHPQLWSDQSGARRTGLPPRKLMQKTAATQSGLVEAKDVNNDTMYLCPVSIGSPPQQFLLNFDTGSADLWLWSSQLEKDIKTKGKASGHHIYQQAASHNFKNMPGYKWNITYGDGSGASGTVGMDDVTVGGLKITQQPIELANKMSQQFAESEGDGLLGLAWGSINTCTPRKVRTPVESMIAQDSIKAENELFTCWLGSWKDKDDADQKNGDSFYTFGYIDKPALQGQEPWYTPIDNSKGFWQFPSVTYSINGIPRKHPDGQNTAIADTGTTLAVLQDDVVADIYDQIPGARYEESVGGYIFPSSIPTKSLPVVKVDIGGREFQIQKEDLGFADAGSGYTYGGIQCRGDLPFDILGDSFLKGCYCIFDVGHKRFGCVQRKDNDDFGPNKKH